MNGLFVIIMIMAGVSLYVAVYHMIIFLRRISWEDFTFSLTCLSVTLFEVFSACLYRAETMADGLHWQRMQLASLGMAGVAFLWFMGQYSRLEKRFIRIALSLVLVVTSLFVLLDNSPLTWRLDLPSVKHIVLFGDVHVTYYEYAPGPIAILHAVAGAFIFIYAMFIALGMLREGERKKGVPLLIGLGILFLGFLNDFFVMVGLYSFIYTIEFVYLALVLIMAYSLTSQVLEAAIIKRQFEKNEKKYRKILESIQEGYYEVDLSGRLTFFNEALCRTLGYSADELRGMNNRQYMSIQNAENVQETFKEIYQTGNPATVYDWEFIKKNGERRNVEASLSLIRDENDRPVGFRGITRDVTERKHLEVELQKSLVNIESTRMATILGFARLAEYRDQGTGAHLDRIRSYVRILTENLADNPKYREYISDKYVNDMYLSSILHDIGKVGIPDAILNKPDKLTYEEFEIIKEHSVIGGEALRSADLQVQSKSFLTLGKEICYYHHERWDGSGYPSGLKGEQIPLSARIVALADVYDALTSERPYKKAFPHEEARQIIVDERGRHFDPDLVDAFLACEKKFESVRYELHSRGSN